MTIRRATKKNTRDDSLGLEHSTAHWVKVLHRSFQNLLQANLAPHGIKLSHWHCLRYLWEEDGLTQRELSRRVHVQETTTVAVIKEMESEGLIRRTRDRDDRRKYAVYLTPKGQRITKRLLPVAKSVNEAGAGDLTPAQIEAYQTLTRCLVANLQRAMPNDDARAADVATGTSGRGRNRWID